MYVLLCAIIPLLYCQIDDFPSEDYTYIESASINFSSLRIVRQSGDSITLGDRVSEVIKTKSNTEVETGMFGVRFGPIDGYDDDDIKFAWNNQDRIMYIEALNDTVITVDGLKIGSSREEVLQTFGIPTIEYSNGTLRYQNIDYELVGIQFEFEDNIVTRLVLFGYT